MFSPHDMTTPRQFAAVAETRVGFTLFSVSNDYHYYIINLLGLCN